MPEEAPALEQEQPTEAPEAPENPDQPGSEEEFDLDSFDPTQVPEDANREWFAERVKALRGDYSRKTAKLADERREAEQAQQIIAALKNPQVAPAILAQLGYDERKLLEMYGYQPEQEEEHEFDDPDERIERLEQTLAERDKAEQSQRYEEAVTDYVSEQIEVLEKKEGREFDREEQRLLDTYARANPTQDMYGRPIPDVEGAFKLLSGIVSSREKALLDPKRKVARPPGGGKPGSRKVDPSKESREERLERMALAADEARGSQAA